MAAKLSKQIAALCLLALLTTLQATAGGGGRGSPDQEQARQLARERMAEAVVDLQERMKACDAKQRTLTKEDLEGVDVTREQLRIALVYFHVRNQNDCTADEAKDFLVATYLVEEAGILKDLGDAKQPELASFIMHSYWQELEHEARYQKLPKAVRSELEATEGLQAPFNLIASGKALGLL